jgi:hypothetical protein
LLTIDKYERGLAIVFLFSLPFINPWVRGDGVGYYAYARAILIEHQLNFEKDWLQGNPSFRLGRIDATGHIASDQYTNTGHLDNHFSVGPAILWGPFLLVAHASVLLYDRFGGHVAADGYSKPYVTAMAMATALYGFLALWISYRLARKYFPERCAFVAVIGIWFASSLPVYMYFNPSWSHAHSAFMVALFVWYWDRSRNERTPGQWVVLGAISGLMVDVYYLNVVLILFPLMESLNIYWKAGKTRNVTSARQLLAGNLAYGCVLFLTILPTLVAKRIIYGNYLTLGYEHLWVWSSPALLKVCFSSDHGLLIWTPVLIPAVAGLFYVRKNDHNLGIFSISTLVVFLYVVGCYRDWHGLSSFGNRFFISLTTLFVLGLAALLDLVFTSFKHRTANVIVVSSMFLLITWNFGLIYQWGTHLIPARGPISWSATARNQVEVVPRQFTRTLKVYLTQRTKLMDHIENEDIRQSRTADPAEKESQPHEEGPN